MRAYAVKGEIVQRGLGEDEITLGGFMTNQAM